MGRVQCTQRGLWARPQMRPMRGGGCTSGKRGAPRLGTLGLQLLLDYLLEAQKGVPFLRVPPLHGSLFRRPGGLSLLAPQTQLAPRAPPQEVPPPLAEPQPAERNLSTPLPPAYYPQAVPRPALREQVNLGVSTGDQKEAKGGDKPMNHPDCSLEALPGFWPGWKGCPGVH